MTSTTAPLSGPAAGRARAADPLQPPSEAELEASSRTCGDVEAAVRSVVRGKDEVIRTAVVTLLSGGHLLLEDVPGVGKTVLATALARAVDAPVRRIQFTPDLLPSDVTGVSIWDPGTRSFGFTPGAVFASVVVADEINRASPKTQSALLECMAEGQVSVDGVTHELPSPFFVVATQNPVDMEGTYPLPEAQRDRFTTRLSVGYPSAEDEVAVLAARGGPHASDPLELLVPVTTTDEVRALVALASRVHASGSLTRYVVDVVAGTRRHPALRLGASPRAGLHLLRASRARALLRGRDHVLPDDVQVLAQQVLAHRLVADEQAGTADGDRVVAGALDDVLTRTPVQQG